MGNSDPPESALREAFGCLALILLLVVCLAAPAVSNQALGAWAALVASVLSILAWAYLGPPLFPGLLPGLMGLIVIGNGLVWAALSLFQLVWAWWKG